MKLKTSLRRKIEKPVVAVVITPRNQDLSDEGFYVPGDSAEFLMTLVRAMDMYIDYPMDQTTEARRRRQNMMQAKRSVNNLRRTLAAKEGEHYAFMCMGVTRREPTLTETIKATEAKHKELQDADNV